MLSSLCLVLLLWQQSEPVKSEAMVLQVSGKAQITRGTNVGTVRMTALLQKGDVITTEEKSEVLVMMFDSGDRFTILPKSKVTLSDGTLSPLDQVKKVEAKRKLAKQDLQNLQGFVGTSRAAVVVARSENPPKVWPFNEAPLLSATPHFTWPAGTDVSAYEVSLQDSRGREIWHARSEKPELVYPKDQKPLETESRYVWRVTPQPAGKVVEAEFRIVNEDDAQRLSEVAQLAKSDDPAELLIAASLLQEQNLPSDAFRIYQQLLADFPDEPALHHAVGRCYESALRKEEAEQAFAKAKELGWIAGIGTYISD